MPFVKVYEKRGKPVDHPLVWNVTTGKIYKTFQEAAADVGGNRTCVSRCCNGLQSFHRGCIFKFWEEKV